MFGMGVLPPPKVGDFLNQDFKMVQSGGTL